MAAATVTFSKIAGENVERWGFRKAMYATLTMVCSSSVYSNGGLADATNFPALWALRLGFNSIQRVMPLGPLRDSTFEKALDFEVDVTNRKVVLFGQGGAQAGISMGTGVAVASATSITDTNNGFVTSGFQVGDVILITGYTGARVVGNGIARVTTVVAGTLTVNSSSLAAAASGTDTVVIFRIGGPGGNSELEANDGLSDGTYTQTVLLIGR